MSGVRVHNYRQGDRSEYLAVYLLSGIGLVTQVPRQEDIGFDLICNLAEQESGVLSFRHHFAVSIKSISTPRVVLDPPDSKKDDPDYRDHFSWLFHLELPLLLAVVDKDTQELALFSTLPAWFLYHQHLNECGIIELVPRTKTSGPNKDVGEPMDCGPDKAAAGRKRFEVDLGFPITVITPKDLQDSDLLRAKKRSLQKAIELGYFGARCAQMGVPFFSWFNVTIPGGYISGVTNPDGFGRGTSWFVRTPRSADQLTHLLAGLAPGLMSAAILFKGINQIDRLNEIRGALLLLPPGTVPHQVKALLPEIFGNTTT